MIIEKLFDEGSFNEIQKYKDSSVIIGFGDVLSAQVYAFEQVLNIKSGAVNKNAAQKIAKIYSIAVKSGAPLIAVFNSKGGEIGEGIELIEAYSSIINSAAKLSGVVPLISIVTGQCSGLNAVLCCMSDIVIMTQEAEMFITPPFVAEDKIEGAGSAEFCAKSGAAHIIVKDASEAALKAREILSLLPANNLETGFCDIYGKDVNNIEITEAHKSLELIISISETDSVIEFSKEFGKNCVTAFGGIQEVSIGFVGIDIPEAKLTAADCAKIARFVNLCDAFSLPVITIIKNEGFEPSVKAEQTGIIRDISKLMQIYASATIPKISLITGKTAGAAAIISTSGNSDYTLAYENAVISPVPVKTASVFLEVSEDEYIREHAKAEIALAKGFIDQIISPSEVRSALYKAIDITRNKRVSTPKRKHINLSF